MSESHDSARSQFLAEIAQLQHRAETAFIRGEVGPRLESWSHSDPVSVFAAVGPSKAGWSELEATFRSVAARLARGADLRYEVFASDVAGDMAWTAGFLTFRVSIDGSDVIQRRLRITHVYRRENDEWRIAHEHSNWEPVQG